MAVQPEAITRGACREDHPHEALVEAMALQDDARARRLAVGLQSCGGAVPAACCLWLRLPPGATYAQAARRALRH